MAQTTSQKTIGSPIEHSKMLELYTVFSLQGFPFSLPRKPANKYSAFALCILDWACQKHMF
jgi:hypothetical protein